MDMPAPQRITTVEELLALPEDGLRHELLDGEHVVSPAPVPNHQRVLGRLLLALTSAVGDRNDIEIFTSPADIQLGPRTLVQPDVFMLASDPENRIERWADAPVPLVAIEILSPSTAARDRGKKRRLYLEAGVEEYWIVDPDARLIERWHRGDERPEIVDRVLEWSVRGGAAGSIDVPELFGSRG